MRQTRFWALAVVLCVIGRANCQETTKNFVIQMTQAARVEHSLDAHIVLTWTTKAGLKQSSGTIRLMKPNYAYIKLSGDPPFAQLVEVSNGTAKYLATSQTSYRRELMDPHGAKIDTPWWGFPFRFFFSQSLNPFSPTADPTEKVDSVKTAIIDGQSFRILQVHGNSVMGGYQARFFFNSDDVLQRSEVQFGPRTKTGVFEAKTGAFEATLSKIHLNIPFAKGSFHFTPAAGQESTSISTGMLAVGQQAPDFTLPSPGGTRLRLSALRRGKKATLVNFWFYDCAPCRLEFPGLEKLYEQYREQGFTVIAIDRGDSAAIVSRYAREAGLTFPIVLGGEPGRGSIFDAYKVAGPFPETYLLNANGRVVLQVVGPAAGVKSQLARLGIK